MTRIIDIHTHGGFGINFNTCNLEQLKSFAKNASEFSTAGFCPTLATDTIENIRRQLAVFAQFKKLHETPKETQGAIMLGVHLEAIFLNPQKAGIQNTDLFLSPSVENFMRIAGDFVDVVKIVTLAPELDLGGSLSDFLKSKNIKVHAGHTTTLDCHKVSCTTHHFNAMPALSHRGASITLNAIINDSIYTEIIADGTHVQDDMLRLFFKAKNNDKIILISDSLPLAKSSLEKTEFCGVEIFADIGGGGNVAKNKEGTIAGSTMFVEDIIKRLGEKGILPKESAQKMAWDNPIEHLGLDEKIVDEMLKVKMVKM